MSDDEQAVHAEGPRASPTITRRLSRDADLIAPDGSEVRVLVAAEGGSMAHFRLAPGLVSRAVRHRTVTELWFVMAGQGLMWRSGPGDEGPVRLEPGTSLAICRGVAFQFRCDGDEPLEVVATTMPPWPGAAEAESAEGPWVPRLGAEGAWPVV